MKSNLELAKSPYENLLALAEINHFLSQVIACDASVDIALDEVARDGLSNLFCILAKECERTLEMMDMAGYGYQKEASHE